LEKCRITGLYLTTVKSPTQLCLMSGFRQTAGGEGRKEKKQ
jgi:hypothetical protein